MAPPPIKRVRGYVALAPFLLVIIASLSSSVGAQIPEAQKLEPVVRESKYGLANISVDPFQAVSGVS